MSEFNQSKSRRKSRRAMDKIPVVPGLTLGKHRLKPNTFKSCSRISIGFARFSRILQLIGASRGLALSSSKFKFASATGGQAIVEYLLVGLAIIAIVAALSLLGGAIGSGMFTQHAADSASHSVTTNTAGSIGDVLLY